MAGTRETRSGTIEVALPPGEAFVYVTPEGERMWVPDWDPSYPAGEVSEAVGTTFVTRAGGVESIWLIVAFERDTASATYARITPGHHAGTVSVRCEGHGEGGSRISVRYDMTTLAPEDPAALEAYAEPAFSAMLGEWQRMIADHVAQR